MLFDGTLGTLKTDTVDFKLKEDANTISSRTFSVLKLQKENLKQDVERLVLLGFLDDF